MKISTFNVLVLTGLVIIGTQGCKKDSKQTAPNDLALSGKNLSTSLSSASTDYTVTTLAGGEDPGFADGYNTKARFSFPAEMLGSDGYLYLVDLGNNAIRKMKISDRLVSTLAGGTAGYADGAKGNAKFNSPRGIALGPDNNFYVTDYYNFKIRKVSRAGLVSTYAGLDSGYVDGPINKAKFGYITAITFSKDGSMYIYDNSASKIRKITRGGIVSTFAGSTRGNADGTLQTAQFSGISNMTFASDGTLYTTGDRLRKISPAGIVSTIDVHVGASNDQFPAGILLTSRGTIFITDAGSGELLRVTSAGVITHVAGIPNAHSRETPDDGVGLDARFANPTSIVLYDNNLYISENFEIAKVTLPNSY